MARYPNEICPKCQKNHRRGRKSDGWIRKDWSELPMQQTFYYEAHLSSKTPNAEYTWKTYRCFDCNMYVMFITHHVKNIQGVNKLVDSIAVNLIRLDAK